MAKQINTLTGKGAMVAAGMETVLAFVASHTQEECAIEYGFASGGGFWNALDGLKKKEWSADWVEPEKGERKISSSPRSKKVSGFLPGRVSDWVVRKLGFEPDDGDKLPERFGPTEFMALPDVAGETPNYLRLLSRLCPDNEIAPLKAWLGCGLTRVERRIPELLKVAADDAAKFFEFRHYAEQFGFRVIADDAGNIQVLGN